MATDSKFGEMIESAVDLALNPNHSIDFLTLEKGENFFKIKYKEKGKSKEVIEIFKN